MKIKPQKIVGNLLHKLRKLYMNGTFIYKFIAVLKKKKILGNICFSEQILYRKQSLGAPDTIPNSFSSLFVPKRKAVRYGVNTCASPFILEIDSLR